MRVFYWSAYGSTKIYLAQTSTQLMSIYEDIKSNMDGWAEELEIEKSDKFILDGNQSEQSIIRSINFLLSLVEDSKHEPFESLGFTEAKG